MDYTVSNAMDPEGLDSDPIRFIVPDVAFATRLKWARDRAGVTQQQIADRCGLSNRTISALENGVAHDILGNNLFCVADFLNVSPRWLVTGIGAPDDADSLSVEISKLPAEQQDAIRRVIESMKK